MDYVGIYDFDERPKRAMELLKLVGLEGQAYKLPMAVSTGQQQSAAIARALATDPPIICADEPTGNLDSRSAGVIIELFDSLAKSGKTIVMVTHDPSLTERTSRTIIISDGELIDETVAQCLSLLDHRQMLEATRQLEHLTYPANSAILQTGQHVDYFFMIKSGVVEVVLQSGEFTSAEGTGAGQNDGVTIARMGPGHFFGEIELVRGGQSIASIQAATDGPVELVALHREPFKKLVSESPLTEEAIGRIVQLRLAENRAADRRRKLP
jgi:energy-coupling factor transporter ATP-binding protein EcfA2